MLIPLLLALAVIFITYKYFTNNYNYWKDLGVPYEEPKFFFGSLKDAILMKKHIGEVFAEIYRKHRNAPYVGYYKLRNPELMVKDPELVKNVLIKDFAHFQTNDIEVSDEETYMHSHPFVLSGEQWKVSRAQLLQCFTPAKLKILVPTMQIVSERFVKYIDELTKEQGAVESKDISTRFTVENVVNSAFGLEGNCFAPGTSSFMRMSYKIFYPSTLKSIRLSIAFVLPQLTKVLNIRLVPKDVADYFIDMITKLVKYRKDENVQRNDFLDILLDAEKKYGKDGYGLKDIICHSMGLFIDGTETSGNTMSSLLYEIANNLDVQRKLHEEIDAVMKKHDGKLSYDAVQEMTYLDCVFQESGRMHPIGLTLNKRCTKDYDLPSPDNDPTKTIRLKAGTVTIIPLYAIHYDETYYPDPERFDPSRFSEENKAKIPKGLYLPFGEGQRMCLGQRFAMLQIKVAVAVLLSKYDLRVNSKTLQPLQIDPRYFMLLPKGGLWLDFRKRQNV